MGGDASSAGTPDPSTPHYHGHRSRLRGRFAASPDSLPDYELLELVLYNAYPRRDTKPLAKQLLETFGSLTEVVNAPDHRLQEISGVGPAVITQLRLIKVAAERLGRAELTERPLLGSWDAVVAHCRRTMAYGDKEQFRILFLDRKNGLIADEVQQQGTVDHTPAYPREVVKRALELAASAVILVHNHPSGDPTPSPADIDMTARIVEAAKALGITVHDHLIVGRAGHTSFRAQGLL